MKVFISYSSIDEDYVAKLSALLDQIGVPYFLDRKDIQWGEDVSQEIDKGLAQCTDLIVVLSPASLQSQWVPYEIGKASALGKRVLPLLTHPSLHLPGFLQRFQFKTRLDDVRAYFLPLLKDQQHDAAKSILSALVAGFAQRIEQATTEAQRVAERAALADKTRSSMDKHRMPPEVFDLWVDQCLVHKSFLTVGEFIAAVRSDEVLAALSVPVGQKFVAWLVTLTFPDATSLGEMP